MGDGPAGNAEDSPNISRDPIPCQRNAVRLDFKNLKGVGKYMRIVQTRLTLICSSTLHLIKAYDKKL